MDWMESLQGAISYMEAHLLEEVSIEETAKAVHISPFYLQKGFSLVTGCTMGEYIRCRRLYCAALEALQGRAKVVELALKYGYETPESFTKAFTRFHGVTPQQLKEHSEKIRVFLPLSLSISVKGGKQMDVTVEKMKGFQVIGIEKSFAYDRGYREIPLFWEEFANKYFKSLCGGKQPENELEQAVTDNCIGEFGVCLDDGGEGCFRYLIAGTYRGGKVPEGMKVVTFPETDWAKFRCLGPLPGALQSVNTHIFKEWLPGNPVYEIAMGANIEWYSRGDSSSPDYESAIWLPVKMK